MKLKTLIKKLQELQKRYGKNFDIVIDHDEHGYYNLEKITIVRDSDGDDPPIGKTMINLKSSNES
jgi:hypothetical protein